MKRLSLIALLSLTTACIKGDSADTAFDDTEVEEQAAQVEILTSMGTVVVELAESDAPITTANFLQYVDDGFFDGDDGGGATLFHRVIPGFMAQGGGVLESGAQKTTREAIALESQNGLSNVRGSIAMARTTDPDTATSQFFINVEDNDFLDYESVENPGYAVFGEVLSGMDVVDAMVAVSTDDYDKPDTDIVIQDMERVE